MLENQLPRAKTHVRRSLSPPIHLMCVIATRYFSIFILYRFSPPPSFRYVISLILTIFFLLQDGDFPGGCDTNAQGVPDAAAHLAASAPGLEAPAASGPQHVRDRYHPAQR